MVFHLGNLVINLELNLEKGKKKRKNQNQNYICKIVQTTISGKN